MSLETTLNKLRERFPNTIAEVYEFRGDTTITLPRESLLDVVRFLHDALRFEMLLDITALDWLPREPRFDVLYYLLSMQDNARLRLRVQLNSDDTNVPSITSIYPGANFYEREVFDLFGITFTGHPFLHRILLPDGTTGHPLRKDHALGYEAVEFTHTYAEIQPEKPSAVAPPKPQRVIGSTGGTLTQIQIPTTLAEPATPWTKSDSDTLLINMGPHHPSTHGVLRVALEVDGEKIVNAMPDIGYLHTGIEKTAENKTYLKAVPLFDRMDYLGTLFNNLAYVLAVEKLMDVDVPERAQIARVVLCEIQRIQSHLVAVGSQAMDVGATTLMLYAFREREIALDIFEMVTGARMMMSYFRFGGLAQDLPEGFTPAVRAFMEMIPGRLKEYEDLLNKNPIWLERTRGIAEYTKEDAIAYGVTGPMLRAAGVQWDLRKQSPYSGYEQYEFDVPVSTRGKADVLECYYIRMEEMRQSLRILDQALKKLAKTNGQPYVTSNRKVAPPPKKELQMSMESLIHHFKLWTEGLTPPVGFAYASVESPRGELGFLVSSDGGHNPHRVHVRTPSFANLQTLPMISKNYYLADLVGIIAMTDIILGDVDR